ncbi:MAG: type IV secretion protein I [Methylophilaceae bacterium]|nr:type IV secretion protein I [Methylophilaceae bacterium]
MIKTWSIILVVFVLSACSAFKPPKLEFPDGSKRIPINSTAGENREVKTTK